MCLFSDSRNGYQLHNSQNKAHRQHIGGTWALGNQLHRRHLEGVSDWEAATTNKNKTAISLSSVRRHLSTLVTSQMELASRSRRERSCLEALPHPSTLVAQELLAQTVRVKKLWVEFEIDILRWITELITQVAEKLWHLSKKMPPIEKKKGGKFHYNRAGAIIGKH